MGKSNSIYRHVQTNDELYFYDHLRSSMRFCRESEFISQRYMANDCGFSEQQIRKYENDEMDEGSVAVPAYVMMMYARHTNKTAEELCYDWFRKGKEKESQQDMAERITAEKAIKRLSNWERGLIWRLRGIKRIALMPISAFLDKCSKEDAELLYCIRQIEIADSNLSEAIRKQIYRTYLHTAKDKDTVKKCITEDLISHHHEIKRIEMD